MDVSDGNESSEQVEDLSSTAAAVPAEETTTSDLGPERDVILSRLSQNPSPKDLNITGGLMIHPSKSKSAKRRLTDENNIADDDGSDAHHDISGQGSNRKDELEIFDLVEGERFITFSDAVIAIAMTLLILPLMEATSDIVAEDDEQITTVQQFFAENSDKVGAFFISFWVVAQFWMVHDKIFRYVSRFSRNLVRLNFFWMLGIVFLPVATSLLTSVPSDKDRLGVVVYILTMLITNIVGGLMLHVIRSDRRVWKGHRGPGMLSVVKNIVFSVLLLTALLLSLFVPAVQAYSLLLLLLAQLIMWFVEWKRPDLSY